MTALQYRTRRVHSRTKCKQALGHLNGCGLKERGPYFTSGSRYDDSIFRVAGGSPRLELKGAVYVGIGLCQSRQGRCGKSCIHEC